MLLNLLNKFLSWLEKRAEKMAIKKLGGIPLLWVIFKPWEKEPNVWFYPHPSIKHDDFLSKHFTEIAGYIRENWEELDKD